MIARHYKVTADHDILQRLDGVKATASDTNELGYSYAHFDGIGWGHSEGTPEEAIRRIVEKMGYCNIVIEEGER